MKHIVLVAAIGVVAAGCSIRSERVVETPAPAATTQRTTTVSTDPYTPATTTTTTYSTPR